MTSGRSNSVLVTSVQQDRLVSVRGLRFQPLRKVDGFGCGALTCHLFFKSFIFTVDRLNWAEHVEIFMEAWAILFVVHEVPVTVCNWGHVLGVTRIFALLLLSDLVLKTEVVKA